MDYYVIYPIEISHTCKVFPRTDSPNLVPRITELQAGTSREAVMIHTCVHGWAISQKVCDGPASVQVPRPQHCRRSQRQRRLGFWPSRAQGAGWMARQLWGALLSQ